MSTNIYHFFAFADELKHMFGIVQPKYIFCEEDVLENTEKALGLLGIDAQIILFDSSQVNEE